MDDKFRGDGRVGRMSEPRIPHIDPLLTGLVKAAEITARTVHRRYRDATRKSRGSVLRPGADTPLWNELVRACAATLKRRGEKVRLARILGISRQRLHVLLVSRTACADAERTLQLMAWLQARRSGQEPA